MSTMQAAIICIFLWTTFFSPDLANQWRFQINLTPLIIIGGLCLIGIGGIASILFPMYWVKQALSNADYDKALRRARLMRFIPVPGNIPLFLEGTILTIAGRNQEAETALRRLKATRTGNRALELNGTLGATLYQMGHYDEAIQLLEEVIKTRPGGTDTYNTLAEVYLAKGDGAQALELADKAMQNKRTRLKSDYFVWGEILANRAWALALLGRCEEAKTQLEGALRDSEQGYKPSLAGQQYRAAQVMRLCGDTAKSTEFLNRALEIDPNGAYGQLAKAALQMAPNSSI